MRYSNPTDFPEYGDFKVAHIEEPFVRATIIVPQGLHLLLAEYPQLVNTKYRILGRYDGVVL